MGKFKEIAELEDSIFQTLESMYQAKSMLNKRMYDLSLATLEILNLEYSELTNRPFIEANRILGFHEDKWSIDWKS